MTDLRDQPADFDATAREVTPVIPLSRHQDIGAILRHLRHRSGYSLNRLSALAYVSKSALSKREHRGGITVGALVEHARLLGYRVALIPDHRDRRYTGTGWPA